MKEGDPRGAVGVPGILCSVYRAECYSLGSTLVEGDPLQPSCIYTYIRKSPDPEPSQSSQSQSSTKEHFDSGLYDDSAARRDTEHARKAPIPGVDAIKEIPRARFISCLGGQGLFD